MSNHSTTFTYEHNQQLPHEPTQRLVKAWANRRGYPITIEEISDYRVRVCIYATSPKEHNRAVGSLSRVLDRMVLRETPLPSPEQAEQL